MNSEIIEEVRRHRTAILESFGGDVGKMMRSLMAKQGSHGHKVVAYPRRESPALPNTYPLREATTPTETSGSSNRPGVRSF